MFSRICIFIALCSVATFAYSQDNTNEIKGKVIDGKGNPIEVALVWLVSSETQNSISQDVTDERGNFSIPCIDKNVKLMITYLGYFPYTSEIFYANTPKDFKEIILKEETQGLDEIVVVGEKRKPIIQQRAGKLIFNVENSINAQGTNAFEVLRQTPGVTVNDGSKNISINGRGNILVMMNGKQTYMPQSEVVSLLKSTPSSNIKAIEVMSNATAQYDAAGSGGILNIILKKNKADGYNMTLNTGIAYWLHLKQNTEVAFNYNRRKINFYGNYSHNFGYMGLFYGGSRKQSGKLFKTDSDDTDKRNTINSIFGIDYEISKQQQIGLQVSVNSVFGPGIIKTTNEVYDLNSNNLLYSIYSESDYYHQIANRYNFNANYKYELSEEQFFTIDLDYSLFHGDSKNNQPNTYYSAKNKVDSILNFHSAGKRDISLYAVTSNYKQKTGNGFVTGGVKYSNITSKNSYDFYNVKNNQKVIDIDASNDFDYTEAILSAYIMYDFSLLKKWQFNTGLRVEYTRSEGNFHPLLESKHKKNTVKKNYTNIFPSGGVTYSIDENNKISFSYGKRIDRPVYSDLNPIEQPLDGLSSWKGNPFLEPQKTHRIALQYQHKRTSVGLSCSKINDYRVSVTDTLGMDRIVMMPLNVGTRTYCGMSLSQSLRFFDVWNISFSGRVYHANNKVNLDEKRSYDRKRWAYGLSLQSSFPLFYGIKSEILGIYSSKRLGGSTDVMGDNGLINFGFQKKYFDDKMSIKLSFSDLFWSSNWDSRNSFGNFESIGYGYGETRLVKCNITFKFGGNKNNYSKKSNIESETNRF